MSGIYIRRNHIPMIRWPKMLSTIAHFQPLPVCDLCMHEQWEMTEPLITWFLSCDQEFNFFSIVNINSLELWSGYSPEIILTCKKWKGSVYVYAVKGRIKRNTSCFHLRNKLGIHLVYEPCSTAFRSMKSGTKYGIISPAILIIFHRKSLIFYYFSRNRML